MMIKEEIIHYLWDYPFFMAKKLSRFENDDLEFPGIGINFCEKDEKRKS